MFRSILSEMSGISQEEKMRKWIHGKKFWEVHVYEKMIKHFGQESRKKYTNEIWKYRALPDDWDEIWKRLENFQPELKIK